jgi:transcriptional regulator with XRE-family HTH domain
MTIQEWREAEGFTQEEAGARVGVKRSHWCRLESGERLPGFRTLVKIVRLSKGRVTVEDIARTAGVA